MDSTIVNCHTMGREAEVAELLAISDDVTQLCLPAVAALGADGFRPAARPPVEKITYYARWGKTESARDR